MSDMLDFCSIITFQEYTMYMYMKHFLLLLLLLPGSRAHGRSCSSMWCTITSPSSPPTPPPVGGSAAPLAGSRGCVPPFLHTYR